MANDALQTLSQKYIRGEISKPEYRQHRKEIINQATGTVSNEALPEKHKTTVKITRTTLILKASVISAIVVGTLIVLYAAI